MLYREIIAVCSEIHTKHINALCAQNVEFLNVELVVYKEAIELYKGLIVLSFVTVWFSTNTSLKVAVEWITAA
jgi:hypothetical protein